HSPRSSSALSLAGANVYAPESPPPSPRASAVSASISHSPAASRLLMIAPRSRPDSLQDEHHRRVFAGEPGGPLPLADGECQRVPFELVDRRVRFRVNAQVNGPGRGGGIDREAAALGFGLDVLHEDDVALEHQADPPRLQLVFRNLLAAGNPADN